MSVALVDLNSQRGGSGRGISFYSTGSVCGRKANLDKKAGDGDPGMAARRGILGHGLLEVFFKRELPGHQLMAVQLAAGGEQSDMEEAQRLVAAYCSRFPEPDFWGEVVGVEYQMPTTDEDAQAVQAYFGVELTARLDLVVRTSEQDIQRIFERTGVMLNPGINIIDHKFKPMTLDKRGYRSWGKPEGDPNEEFELRCQFTAYPMMWDTLEDEPCVGMLANGIVGTKDVSFQLTYRPPPLDVEIDMIKRGLGFANNNIVNDIANPFACRGPNKKTCGHYKSGACRRV